MTDAMRSMLDELMGKERNVPLDKRTGRGLKFSDHEICKYALEGLCPYGLFRNTKSDLGACKYEMHEDDLQFDPLLETYQQLPERDKQRYGYRAELHALLLQLVRDMDRKVERQKERAAKENEPRPPTSKEQEQLETVKGKQLEATVRSEHMAEAGDVDGSMAQMQQAEAFQKQYESLHKQFTTPERIMAVCDVCAVFINSTDNDQRRADHLAGKQYLGWLAIRDKFKELNEQPPPATFGEPADNGHPASSRPEPAREQDKHRSSSHREPSSSHRDRDRDRERPREPHRERERDRDGHRDRSRHREREQSHAHFQGQEPRHRHSHGQSHRPREREAAAAFEEGEVGYVEPRQAPDARHRHRPDSYQQAPYDYDRHQDKRSRAP